MKKLLAGAILILLLGAGCSPTEPTNDNANTNDQAGANVPAASIKFADQSYYKDAYLISGTTMAAKTKEAIAGFSITKKALADGTTQYNLTALKSEYKDQVYILKPGEQLYFIEKFLGDDDTKENTEGNMIDDMAVVVDADGNVVNPPASWTK